MVKNLLILGASGLTGHKLMQQARQRFETFGTYNKRIEPGGDKSLVKLEVKDEENLRNVFRDISPDVVINTIALQNVDFCEYNHDEAFYINAKVVAMIAKLCNNMGSRLIHISTDFVFDGVRGNYSEIDPPNPINVYGKSKLEGEIQARTSVSNSIIRPSVVYGWTPIETHESLSSSGKPLNFALWALSKIKRGEDFEVVNDQFTSPTFADVLATVALKIAELDTNALYHVAGTGCISRYEFTRKIANMMGYSSSNIKPVESGSFPQKAQRPKNTCLSCEKLKKVLGYSLPELEKSLSIMRSQIESESPDLLGNF